MATKRCKNKKCNKVLPDGYKHKYCEACRNEQVHNIKKIGKATLGTVGTAILCVITAGRFKKKL